MTDSGRAFALATMLVGMAFAVYGVGFLSVNALGDGGLFEPCVFTGESEEGSSLGTSFQAWPPGYTCEETFKGDTDTTSVEASWVPPLVICLLLGAGVIGLAALVANARRATPNR